MTSTIALPAITAAVIAPEGTRFTPERRARAIARIAERDPRLAARADQLRYLLPPRLGGVGALLDGAPDADVVVVAHHGFDGLRLISDVWRGGLVGLVVRVRVTRVPRSKDWLGRRFAGSPTRAAA